MTRRTVTYGTSEEILSKGRSGLIKTTGCEILDIGTRAWMYPINSKGAVSDACALALDPERLDEIALALIELHLARRPGDAKGLSALVQGVIDSTVRNAAGQKENPADAAPVRAEIS